MPLTLRNRERLVLEIVCKGDSVLLVPLTLRDRERLSTVMKKSRRYLKAPRDFCEDDRYSGIDPFTKVTISVQ